jgi:hypothetical protein
MLRGESRSGPDSAAPELGAVRDVPDLPEMADALALWRRWWPRQEAPDPGALYKVALASRGDAETKAARALRTSPVAVALPALSRWDHSFTEERDARVTQRVGDRATDARALQALRGHVTRQLMDELRPALNPVMKNKRR